MRKLFGHNGIHFTPTFSRNKRFLRSVVLVTSVMIVFTSCYLQNQFSRERFTYSGKNRNKKLVFRLPKGRSEEKFRVGDRDAKEQFYYFGDGSVFYVARHITWKTVNNFRIDALPRKEGSGATFSGIDQDGLYWKEVHFEEFQIGYAYVHPGKLAEFNLALNSIRIK